MISRILSIQKSVTYSLELNGTTQEAIDRVLKAICTSLDWQVGAFWEPDLSDAKLHCTGFWSQPNVYFDHASVKSDTLGSYFAKGISLPGRVWESKKTTWITRIDDESNFTRKDVFLKAGLRSAISAPVTSQGIFWGVIEFYSLEEENIEDEITDLMTLIGAQIGLYLRSALALQAVKEAEYRFHNIIDSSNSILFIKDLEGKFLLVNDQFQLITHFNEDHIIGKTDFDLFPPEVAQHFRANDLKALEEGKAVTFEEKLPDTAEEKYFLSIKFPLFDSQGKLYASGGISTDITERKHNENRLYESEERLRIATEAAELGTWDFNPATTEMKWSDKCKEIFGFSKNTPINHHVFLNAIDPVDRDLVQRRIQQALDPLIKRNYDVEFRTYVNNRQRWMHAVGKALFKHQHAYRFIGIIQDITLKKEYEHSLQLAKQQLEIAKNVAESASHAKSDFVANVSHEIRTPISSIIGTTELLYNTTLTEEQQDYLQTIHQAGEILLGLINDILDFSKIEAGEMEIHHAPFKIRTLLHEVMQIFKPHADRNHFSLSFHIEEDIPNLLIGDSGRLKQILLNLIGNALKFTKEGSITVRVKNNYQTTNLVTLLFEVDDTGIGIAPEKLKTIFDKFIQAERFTSKRFGGTGLGLAISKQLIELMEGNLEVKSTLGKGSCFWFKIPFYYSTIQKSDYPEELIENQQTQEEALFTPITPKFSGKVLVVDDYLPNQTMAKKLLEKMGFTVDVASDGAEALDRLKDDNYAVVFMDCQMPEMDGYETTRLIRQDKRISNHLIVAMTANALEGDREKCIAAGMDDYISKPIRSTELEKLLMHYLQHA